MLTTQPYLRCVADGDGAVVLDIKRDQFFSLNPLGAYIWNELTNNTSLYQIKANISRQMDVELAVVSSDVDEFVAALQDKGLFPSVPHQ